MRLDNLSVGHLMTTALITMKPDSALSRADADMKLAGIRHIPVTNDGGRLLGILSNRDLFRGFAGAEDREVIISEIMTRNVHTVRSDTLAYEAANMMIEHKIGALPVIGDEGQLIGLVTETDFLVLARDVLEAEVGE